MWRGPTPITQQHDEMKDGRSKRRRRQTQIYRLIARGQTRNQRHTQPVDAPTSYLRCVVGVTRD